MNIILLSQIVMMMKIMLFLRTYVHTYHMHPVLSLSSLKQPRQNRTTPQPPPIQLRQRQPQRPQHRARYLTIAHFLRDVLAFDEFRIIRDERDVQILRQEAAMVGELEADVPESAGFGADDEVRDAGVQERGAVACEGDFVAGEDVGDAEVGCLVFGGGEEILLCGLGVRGGFEPHNAAVFADEVGDGDAGGGDDGLGVGYDEGGGVDGALALFAADEEEGGVVFVGGAEVREEVFQTGVGGVEGGEEAAVRLAAGEVAGVLLRPGYGLEVGAVETRGAGGVGRAVGPIAESPVS